MHAHVFSSYVQRHRYKYRVGESDLTRAVSLTSEYNKEGHGS